MQQLRRRPLTGPRCSIHCCTACSEAGCRNISRKWHRVGTGAQVRTAAATASFASDRFRLGGEAGDEGAAGLTSPQGSSPSPSSAHSSTPGSPAPRVRPPRESASSSWSRALSYQTQSCDRRTTWCSSAPPHPAWAWSHRSALLSQAPPLERIVSAGGVEAVTAAAVEAAGGRVNCTHPLQQRRLQN